MAHPVSQSMGVIPRAFFPHRWVHGSIQKMKLKYPLNWIIMWSEMGGNKGKQTLADLVYLSIIWQLLLWPAPICNITLAFPLFVT